MRFWLLWTAKRSTIATGTAASSCRRMINNYKGAYARVVMCNEPDLAGFITIRELAD
jgi:S-methylmethionine-dependent homocysteine/selenocysteine methylase